MAHQSTGKTQMTLILRWFLNALALMLVAYFYSGVQVSGISAALIAALVLGLVNALIRPVLILLTLPVTLLTLGLFIFVINALMFWLVAEMVPGFKVSGFLAALLGSLMFSVITMVTSFLIPDGKNN
jgi:putative membrane protein